MQRFPSQGFGHSGVFVLKLTCQQNQTVFRFVV